jgi:predicted nucleic acid-binding protein
MIEEKADRFIYLDSNVFIYFFEGGTETAQPICELFAFAETGSATGGALTNFFVTSELTLAEVLSSRKTTEDARQLYIDLILDSSFIAVAPVRRDILFTTAEIRRKAGLKLTDAIHVATAVHHGCSILISSDSDMKRADEFGIVHLEPTPSNLTQVVETLSAN